MQGDEIFTHAEFEGAKRDRVRVTESVERRIACCSAVA